MFEYWQKLPLKWRFTIQKIHWSTRPTCSSFFSALVSKAPPCPSQVFVKTLIFQWNFFDGCCHLQSFVHIICCHFSRRWKVASNSPVSLFTLLYRKVISLFFLQKSSSSFCLSSSFWQVFKLVTVQLLATIYHLVVHVVDSNFKCPYRRVTLRGKQ